METDTPLTLSSWPNAILHIDGDAFFASCEQAVHPELKGKPVITGMERNIVASMSYEAKRLGVKRAIPLHEARRICPQAIVVPSDYETYSLISKRMFGIMRRFTPIVEEYSIDEGFAELNGLRRLYRTNYGEIARKMRDAIEKELDIPVSAGLSLTRTLAKLASKHNKPRGFTLVSGRHIHRFLAETPVEKVTGIGPNTTALLHKRGIITALDFARKPEGWAHHHLGKIGEELWKELRGERVYTINPVEKDTYASISKTKTFTPPSEDYAFIKAQLYRNTESAFIKLRRYHLQAQRVILFLRTQQFQSSGMECDLNRATTSPQEAFQVMEPFLKELFRPGTPYRQTGVVLTRISEDSHVQFELFEDTLKVIKQRRLAQSIDEINALFGKHTVSCAQGLYLKNRRDVPDAEKASRNRLPQRKREMLAGETDRQRLGLPFVRIRV